jgi:hypothetical protein
MRGERPNAAHLTAIPLSSIVTGVLCRCTSLFSHLWLGFLNRKYGFTFYLIGTISQEFNTRKPWEPKQSGALARFYSAREWRSLASKYFDAKKILVYGSKAEMIPLPGGGVKSAVLACIPNLLSRFLTNQCRFGSLLVSVLEKD